MAKKKNNKITHSTRFLAMEILDAIETEGAYSNILLNATIEKENLSDKDAGLLTELVYGVTQRRLTLDYGLSPFIKTPKKLESWVRNLLRLSAYQMVYLDKIPDHAILYDAVEIAKHKGHIGISKLANGILRNVQRNGLKDWQAITDPLKSIHVGASVPLWLVEKFNKEIGIEKTERLFFSLLTKPYLAVRVQDAEQFEAVVAQLEEEGMTVERSPISAVGLRVLSGKVTKSPLFQEGKITIQDETSQLVAQLGHLNPFDHVLDACAAPGGKTMHMASYLSPEGNGIVHALDIHEHKIRLIQENAERMQVSDRVETHLLNAKDVASTFKPETFDAIFVDAPCSGFGLMRRKPEIKYGVTAKDVAALHEEQTAILAAVEPLLKKGGRLIYSTCTLTIEENEQTVRDFLAAQPNYRTVPAQEKITIPNELMTKEGFVKIYPDDFGTDGFFICLLEKQM